MLKTDYLGIKLENPLIVSAGPWNRDGESIRESIKAGAGAVVTESIISDTMIDVRPSIFCDERGAQNIRLYSDIQIEGWERELMIAKSEGGVVIASISAHTPSELAYMASKLEKFGADAIELSVSNPMAESLEVIASHADTIYDMTKAVVSSIKIPVVVKLSQNTTNISKVAKAAKEAGASGVSAINTVRGILGIDLETCRPSLSTYGGISGDYIRPLGLASVATVSQTVDIPVSGIGGVNKAEHILEYIMLGASTVQMGTAIMLQGKAIIRPVLEELERWLREHKIRSIDEIRGRALNNMKSFDEMRYEPSVSTATGVACREDCNKCVICCMYGAINRKKETVDVTRSKCVGCGVCVSACPAGKLSLIL